MKTIKVALIGTGFGQKVHLPAFCEHPRTEVVAVYHRDLDKAQKIAQDHNIPLASDNLSEIIARPEIDAVSISTLPCYHYDMSCEVLRAAKHLLLEKPTTMNQEEALHLYELSQAAYAEHGAIAIMDFEFRFVPAWQYLHKLLQDQTIGNIRLIKIDWLVASRADETRVWDWYSQTNMGGGVLNAFAAHTFDYIPWLFKPVKRLCANLRVGIPKRPDPQGAMRWVDAEDTVSVMLELNDGIPCHVIMSAIAHQGRGHWIEIYGDRGTLILGSDNLKDYIHGFKLWGSLDRKPMVELEIPSYLAFNKTYSDGRIAPFIRVIDQWIEGIDKHKMITPSLREGLYSQRLIDLARESHIKRSWVNV